MKRKLPILFLEGNSRKVKKTASEITSTCLISNVCKASNRIFQYMALVESDVRMLFS